MAAWGYEFYLRMRKVSLTSERNVYYIDFDEMSRFKTTCLFIFEMMKKWSPTAKTRMLCNMKQDMKVMKSKS